MIVIKHKLSVEELKGNKNQAVKSKNQNKKKNNCRSALTNFWEKS